MPQPDAHSDDSLAVIIRRAADDDAAAIARILSGSFVEFRDQYTRRAYDATTPGADGVLERMREGPLWIAEIDGDPVATAGALETDHGLYIRGMATLPGARGRSVATTLLNEIEGYARERRIHVLYLCTTPFLERATALYERSGFSRGGPGSTEFHGTVLVPMIKRLADPCTRHGS